jgi:tRNA/rRNA methyltransferase
MLDNVRIVLVSPRGSGNVGSVARAMKNMGLSDLATVGPARTRTFWARAMAVHARDLLERARSYPTLGEAVADCRLVVGTTCRTGLYRGHSLPPRELAPEIVAAASAAKVAIVFGPEDHGLSNRDLIHFDRLITIPASPLYPSLNVAQAVMIVAYELFLAAAPARAETPVARAPAASVERLFDRMRSSLLRIGFLDPQNPDHILLALRRLLGRAGLEERDVRILNGLLRHIEWYAEGGWKTLREKEARGLKPR